MTREDLYEKVAEQYGSKNGFVTLAECKLCGCLEWVSTSTTKPRGYVVVELHAECPYCMEVAMACPEVFIWVMKVVNKLKEDLEGK